ncbi:6-phosphogluconolactonase [Haematospirillum jordaniae]|uniref:6-phosphogluconolactonase n=1 Tax=Haematospirillum jordaniae TaxID=1549855 RepID=UPI001432EFA9|nr:6-phosphogluconolactonase [Haematospirillum jordaniae]NKD86261.1 6-phosphogluconolactonase [Haematospirillum jordaniae]
MSNTMTSALAVFPDATTLAESAASLVADSLSDAVSVRGWASLVVPGGRTPAQFLSCLSTAVLPWDRVSVTLTDERWVGLDDAGSNEAMVRRNLLTASARRAQLVPLYTGESSPAEGIASVDRALGAFDDAFDMVVLGMGEDGHIASLFPGEPTWPQPAEGIAAGQFCVPAIGIPSGPERISLTLGRLVNARSIVVLATGESKRRLWEDMEAGGPSASLPIGALQASVRCPLTVLWCP